MIEFIESSLSLDYKQKAECSVNNIGYEQCRPGYRYGPRICPYHLIHFVISGEGELHIDEKCITIKKGDAFLIPADRIAWYRASKKDPWMYAWIGFLGFRAGIYFEQLMSAAPERYVLRSVETEKYAAMIREGAALSESSYANYFKSNSILMEILGELFAEIGSRAHERRRTMADEIRYYLEMRYSEKIRLSELAGVIGIHPNYLTRVFREKYQITPKQYLMNLKLEKACQQLTHTDYPVSLISDTLGFEDQMSFAKTFRGRYKMTPSQYRKEI